MPFASLPSSPGFTPPQSPDWASLANKSVDLLAHRPIIDTGDIINRAVDQINNIIKLSSPKAKMQRQLQMLQMQTMMQVYQDYKQHPEKYQMTAHGPVMIDPVARTARLLQIKKATDEINKNTNQQQLPAPVQWVRDHGGNLPVTPAEQPAAPETLPNTGDNTATTLGSPLSATDLGLEAAAAGGVDSLGSTDEVPQ